VGLCFIERVRTKAFISRHRKIEDRFFKTISLAAVIGKDFGDFDQAVAAPPFDWQFSNATSHR
jgi:hypothetical protein